MNPQYTQQGPNDAAAYIQDTIKNPFKLIQNPIINNIMTGRSTGLPSLKDYIFTAELRHYFNVNNRYVLKKIKMILFPFISQEESSKTLSEDFFQENNPYQLPKKSLSSPDLYIPVMAIMTFILMMCFTKGMGDNFAPELIGYYLTNCLLASIFEIFVYKIVLVLVHIRTLSMWDLVALVNYKYVGLCFIMMLNLILSPWFIFLFKLYVSLTIVIFMHHTLKGHSQNTPSEAAIGSHTVPVQTVIYILSGFQFLTVWLVIKLTTE